MIFVLLFALAFQLPAAVTVRTVRSSGGDYPATLAGLQGAVDYCRTLNATDPCVVEVEAGAVITGPACNLVLNAQTAATKLIVIRSSRLSELPDGVRVTQADAPKLAKIVTSCAQSPGVVIVPPEVTGVLGTNVASHYMLQGLELHYAAEGRNAGGAINIGLNTDGSTKARAHWQAPHTITVDRCWTHGNETETWITANSTHANQMGVRADGRNLTIKNSRLSDNNMDSVDHGQGESKGLGTSNGPGPLYVYNNYIDGAIGSLMGGEWTWIPGLVLTGSWWWGNEYSRNPYAWHWLDWDTTDSLNAAEPCITGSFFEQKAAPLNKWKCVGGSWQPTTENRINRGWTKNAWECKNCRLAVAEGNYIHDIPSVGDQSQFGFAFLVNNVDAQDGAYFARPENISIRFNRAVRTGQGPTVAWLGDTKSYKRNNNVTVENNLIVAFGGARVSPTQGGIYTSGGGWQAQVSGFDQNLRIARNTFLYDRTFGGGGIRLAEGPPVATNVYLQDNILSWGVIGQSPLDNINESCAAFRTVMLGAVYWNYFGLIDTNGRGQAAFNTVYGNSACPPNKSRVATFADVKFVNYNNTETGDYRLCTGPGVPHASCTGASPWATASSTGGPLGADAQQVMYASGGAETGTPDYKFLEFQIRRADKNEVRYTAYDDQACSGTITGISGPPAYSWNDSGGNRERSITPGTLQPGSYTAKVTCAGGRWREEQLRVY
ncbi:MAG: hypothetical protein JNK87_37890 [Bryobacterales bacterium]|nr:hypothetical protein [Bryobacterales bacterium]